MKVLLFSDLHLHPWQYGSTYFDGWNSRLLIQKKFLEHVAEVVRKEDIECVIFCGDLFHTHGKLTADVITVAYNGFKEISSAAKKCFSLVGNHDFQSANGYINSMEFIKGTGWDVIFPRGVEIVDSLALGFISYTPDRKVFSEALEKYGKMCNFIFMHQGVQSVPLGNGFELPNEYIIPDELDKKVIHFTGHYHRHQKVKENLVIVGSPMQHTWSDSGDERGYIILDTGTKEWNHVPYNAPKFVEVDIRSDYGPVYYNNNYVRLIGEAPFSDFERIKEDMRKGGALSVEIRPTLKESTHKVKTADKITLDGVVSIFEKESKATDKAIKMGKILREGAYGT